MFSPGVWQIPWRRKWQSTPVFLPGKSHGQRHLVGYSPWGLKRAGDDLATEQGIVSEHCQDSVTLWAWSEWIYIEREPRLMETQKMEPTAPCVGG